MSTKEVAKKFNELAQSGNWEQIVSELYHKDAESIEPAHSQVLISVKGVEAIREKGKQWNSMIEEVHGGYSQEPQVAGNYFSCAMGFEATFKGQGRMNMEEIALYEVKDGKIVKEQFFY